MLKRLITALALSLIATAAKAQPYPSYKTPAGADVPASVALCIDQINPGRAVVCPPGAAGGGGGAAAAPVTYLAPAASSVATGGTAVTALTAGMIHTGFDIKNPGTATETLYFSLTGTAGTSEFGSTFGLAPGSAYHGSATTAQALSVNAATAGHVFAAMGY